MSSSSSSSSSGWDGLERGERDTSDLRRFALLGGLHVAEYTSMAGAMGRKEDMREDGVGEERLREEKVARVRNNVYRT